MNIYGLILRIIMETIKTTPAINEYADDFLGKNSSRRTVNVAATEPHTDSKQLLRKRTEDLGDSL
ncbi:MAG: hypothetical protein VZR95_02560 [Alphaproteobacteria bacterium]